MNIFQTIILSVVEGLTEFLPISSTAHLVLTSELLHIQQTEFVKSFEVIIQLGAILAVVALYFKELAKNIQLWYKTILAFLPSAIVGFILYDFIKGRLIGNGLVTALALIIGGLVFTLIDRFLPNLRTKDHSSSVPSRKRDPSSLESVDPQSQPDNYQELHKNRFYDNPKFFPPVIDDSKTSISNLSPKKLVVIGLFQSLAVVPGLSRSAASIFGGLLTGLNKKEATKFSFFLAIPTMLAATTLDLYKSNFNFSQQELLLLATGFIGSFITALFAVKLFISFVQKHSFLPFGVYRILIGLAWLLFITQY